MSMHWQGYRETAVREAVQAPRESLTHSPRLKTSGS
jgi:hypothetical protein